MAQRQTRTIKKRLIICWDGTTNDGINTANPLTNVSRIARCIKYSDDSSGDDPIIQTVYYRSGVGTGTSRVTNSIDTIFGRGINHHIREAYFFLSQNYCTGDEIVLVGFSRGAFTVRALATLINDVGILKNSGLKYLRPLFDRWKTQRLAIPPKSFLSYADWPNILERLERDGLLVRNVQIQACAVWDTVPALPGDKLRFVDERVPGNVELAVHALALNEERTQFRPLLFKLDPASSERPKLKQCWFLGVHSDIGGGNKSPDLANIALAWTISELRGVIAMISLTNDVDTKEARTRTTVRESGEGHYGFTLRLPVAVFQSKTDIRVSTFSKLQRVFGWSYRQPMVSGDAALEQLHWSVDHLLETEVVKTCVPRKRLTSNQTVVKVLEQSDAERKYLTEWTRGRLLGILGLSHGKAIISAQFLPIYAVLRDPASWRVCQESEYDASLVLEVTGTVSLMIESRNRKDMQQDISLVKANMTLSNPYYVQFFGTRFKWYRNVRTLHGIVKMPFGGTHALS